MKINEFFFSEALDTLEIGHVIGGATSSTGEVSCNTDYGRDSDSTTGGDVDEDLTPPVADQDQP